MPTEQDLQHLGNHCGNNERRAEAAERELRHVLILRLLAKRVGEKLGGVVTGVANVGVFVQLDRYLIEGLLRFDRLPGDWWEVDSSRGAVVGELTGQRITVGDRLKVTISRVDPSNRQMDLDLTEPLPAPAKSKKTGRAPAKSKGARPTTAKRTTKKRTATRTSTRPQRRRKRR